MIKIENYPNAYKEVYVILNYMNKQELEKIPQSFMDMLQKNMNKDYEFELDASVDFEEQSLLKETKVILAYIFLNYWGTEKQRVRIEQKFRNDIAKEEYEKTKYNSKDLFLNKISSNSSQSINQNEETKMIVYKEKNILSKFICKLKKLFKGRT